MHRLSLMVLALAGLGLVLCDTALAQRVQRQPIIGGNENPPVATLAGGNFRVELFPGRIAFRLRYARIDSNVLQAHLHAGNPGENGPIVVFLCTNVGGTPPGATDRPCPPAPAVVTGDIVAADVIGGVIPGLGVGDLNLLRRLINQGAVYVNVHSADVPSGEVRGQLSPRTR
ncbi:MAG TPA: CHRD domain-containing protein [Geminicoccaceae bacterium]|nr:CHRD domain-containing protein [Geminicoccaceae bacterium]